MSHLTPRYVRVVERQQQGEAAYCYTFEPVNFIHDKPVQVGQYFWLELPAHHMGMFVYCALPDEHGQFKMLYNSTDKHLDHKLQQGSVLQYFGPLGGGWPVDKLRDAEVLIVAGDFGLAPLAPVIDYLIEQGQAQTTTVIYGCSSSASQILADKRQAWRSKLLLFETMELVSGSLAQGSPTDFISTLLAEHDRQPQIVLICGPNRMMQDVADLCISLVINRHKIWCMQQNLMQTELNADNNLICTANQITLHEPIRRYDSIDI